MHGEERVIFDDEVKESMRSSFVQQSDKKEMISNYCLCHDKNRPIDQSDMSSKEVDGTFLLIVWTKFYY